MISNIQHIPSFTPKNDCFFENKVDFKRQDQPFFNFDYSFCACSYALQYTNSLDSVKNYDTKEQKNNKPFYNLEEQFQALLIKVSLMGRFRGAFITTDEGSGIGSGNDTGIGSLSPELVEQRHFDAWGGLVFLQKEGDTEAEFFNEAKYDEELYLDRGYTGHEHLASVSLIHMNGRLYDAKLRRFLAPDNFIQDPYNTQNFNRYAYVYNNPLIYNDPSGEFIGTVITALVETLVNIVTRGVNFHNYSYDRTRMAWKIDMGLLKTDSNRSFFSRVRQLISRFTWELPQTTIGYSYSHGRNAAGKVDEVKYFGGATFVINENAGKRNGISLGSFININIRNQYNADGKGLFGEDGLYMHEFGHYLQSQIYGVSYLPVIGLFSLTSAGSANHNYKWYETDANKRAFRYLNKYYEGEFNWNFNRYPF